MTEDYGLDAARLEQRVAELSDDEFDQLVARTRPPRLPKGNHVPHVGAAPDAHKVARSEIADCERRGDWATAFALKAAKLNEMMRKNH